jgi:hypothetical protein
MDNSLVTVHFPDATVAERNLLAEELRGLLLESGWGRDLLAVEREQSATQDVGTILTVILSSGAVVAFAKGLATFASKSASRITVTLPTGESIVITGDATSHKKAAEIISAALTPKRR